MLYKRKETCSPHRSRFNALLFILYYLFFRRLCRHFMSAALIHVEPHNVLCVIQNFLHLFLEQYMELWQFLMGMPYFQRLLSVDKERSFGRPYKCDGLLVDSR